MIFIDQRINDLVEAVSLDTVGGPSFSTTVAVTAASFEQRNQNWGQDQGRWELGERLLARDELAPLISFFKRARGRLAGFRFRDWADYMVEAEDGIVKATAVAGVFALYKRYPGEEAYDKRITKPVADTIDVYVDGELVPGVPVDALNGTITIDAPEALIRWSGEFDLPCRFDTDSLQHTFRGKGPDSDDDMFWISSLPIKETKPGS